MAEYETVAGEFFASAADLDSISLSLGTRVHNAAVMARMLHDMALYGAVGYKRHKQNADEIEALAAGLLAYIGQIDPLVQQLDLLASFEFKAADAKRDQARGTNRFGQSSAAGIAIEEPGQGGLQ